MPDRIKEQIRKKEKYLKTLEERDRTGKMFKASYRERTNFTLDVDTFVKFRNYCEGQGIPMSRKIEQLIKDFLEKVY